MSPNPKKRKTTGSKRATSLPVHAQKNLDEWGEKADASNLERGLLSLPFELLTEILDYFPAIGPYKFITYSSYRYRCQYCLPNIYLVRINMLRALSQVCIDYRRVFLPLLWESFNICFIRKDEYFGDALVRKCDSLLASPNLASYIG
jgi:hypothetical protein